MVILLDYMTNTCKTIYNAGMGHVALICSVRTLKHVSFTASHFATNDALNMSVCHDKKMENRSGNCTTFECRAE